MRGQNLHGCMLIVPAPVTTLTLPPYVNPQASAIDFRTSSIPNGGLVLQDVIMGGRQLCKVFKIYSTRYDSACRDLTISRLP